MKRQNIRKSASFASLNSTIPNQPSQFRQLGKSLLPNKPIKHKAEMKERSFSDSDSSESSCIDKKFYRCGCLSSAHGCHQYRDYLTEIRMERLRRKEKAKSNPFDFELDKLNTLSLSEDTERSEPEEIKVEVCTPKKETPLDRIIEINESAEYSKKKNFNSITITLNGKKYYKTFTNKEEVLACFCLLEDMLAKQR